MVIMLFLSYQEEWMAEVPGYTTASRTEILYALMCFNCWAVSFWVFSPVLQHHWVVFPWYGIGPAHA